MSYIQNGVDQKSKMFFSPVPQNKELFFYPLSAGHFYCNSDYRVERDRFDSILLTYIVKGSFSFLLNGCEVTAHSGELALLDCFNHHAYYTNESFEAYWIHINGANIYELYKGVTSRFSNIIACNDVVEKQIKEIYSIIKDSHKISENMMSLKIYELLTNLFNQFEGDREGSIIKFALDYMTENYSHNITVLDVAEAVHLSQSQFSRKFKKHTGISPYDYILRLRLTKAKELLKNTSLPISEIAYQTGFQSDSNFIYFFKKHEDLSPLKFRNIEF